MPIQDDNIEYDHLSRRISTPKMQPVTMPWKLNRTYTLQTCSSTGKRIMLFTKAWRQECYLGKGRVEEEWLSPAAYTFKKLAGTL